MTTSIENNTNLLNVTAYTHFVAVQTDKVWNLVSGHELEDDAAFATLELTEKGDAEARVWNRENAMRNVEHNVKGTVTKTDDGEKVELSSDEKKALAGCRRKIVAYQKAYVSAGAAIVQIEDDKLYRDKYKTVEELCIAEFDMSRTHAFRLKQAAHVVAHLTIAGLKEPASESQARELVPFLNADGKTGLDTEQLVEFWGTHLEELGKTKPTAAGIKQARIDAGYLTTKEAEKKAEDELRAQNAAALKDFKGAEEGTPAAPAEPTAPVVQEEDNGLSKAQEEIARLTETLRDKEEELDRTKQASSLVSRQLKDAKANAAVPDNDLMRAVLQAGFNALAKNKATTSNPAIMAELLKLREQLDKSVKFTTFDLNSLA